MAMAQSVPDHPRVNEVNQRLDNQQARINQGLANGTMTGKQAARDEAHDATSRSAKAWMRPAQRPLDQGRDAALETDQKTATAAAFIVKSTSGPARAQAAR